MMSGMGMGGYEDPEMAQMRQMISGAVDAGYDAAYRAKEGKLKTTGRTGYHVSRAVCGARHAEVCVDGCVMVSSRCMRCASAR